MFSFMTVVQCSRFSNLSFENCPQGFSEAELWEVPWSVIWSLNPPSPWLSPVLRGWGILLACWPTRTSRLLASEQPVSFPHQEPWTEGLLVVPGFVDGVGRAVKRCQASSFKTPSTHSGRQPPNCGLLPP